MYTNQKNDHIPRHQASTRRRHSVPLWSATFSVPLPHPRNLHCCDTPHVPNHLLLLQRNKQFQHPLPDVALKRRQH